MSLDLGLHQIGIDLLSEWDRNPRAIDDERFAQLKRSLKADPEMLQARPLIARPDGTIIAGNMRLRALREMGVLEVPVFVADVDDKRAVEIALRDNNAYGEWVPDELAVLIRDYQSDGGEIDLLGFADDELARLLSSDPLPGDQGNDGDLPHEWSVIVTCEDEVAQAALIERLESEGYATRALIT